MEKSKLVRLLRSQITPVHETDLPNRLTACYAPHPTFILSPLDIPKNGNELIYKEGCKV